MHQIHFGHRGGAIELTGHLEGHGDIEEYTLRVGEPGHYLKIYVSTREPDRDLQLAVILPSGARADRDMQGSKFVEYPAEPGEYYLTVFEGDKAAEGSLDFTLEVAVERSFIQEWNEWAVFTDGFDPLAQPRPVPRAPLQGAPAVAEVHQEPPPEDVTLPAIPLEGDAPAEDQEAVTRVLEILESAKSREEGEESNG
ncbi:MAG TPA: hypothetical protein VI756_15395 [Blastocatellia bacterium]